MAHQALARRGLGRRPTDIVGIDKVDADDVDEIAERDLLEARVDCRAGGRDDRDLVPELAGGDRRLGDAPLRGGARDEEALALQLLEDERERRVVERRVARLDDESFPGPRQQTRDDLASWSL